MDLASHPRFSQNKLIYFTYHKPAANSAGDLGNNQGTITLARGRWDGVALVDVRDLFSAIPCANASRIVFGKDGMVYMTVGIGEPPGARSERPCRQGPVAARRWRRPAGQSLCWARRLPPRDFTLGHWNTLGLAVQPHTGAIWECEDGPNGGDEINVLQPGKNYGWPVISFGRFYLGPLPQKPWQEGMEQPQVFWVPVIAISGLTFYTGDMFPNWKKNVFVGGLRQGEVPSSGHLERIDFKDKWEELHRESMLRELQQRIRDVREGLDGYLYMLTAENDGAMMRMEPAPANPSRPALIDPGRHSAEVLATFAELQSKK